MDRNYKKLSSHGSISIPVAMRREIGLQPGDPMEVSVNQGTIEVKAYTPRCIFCESTENVESFHGKHICRMCIQKVHQNYGGNMNE